MNPTPSPTALDQVAQTEQKASALAAAGAELLIPLTQGQPLEARLLRQAMTKAFGADDSAGAWVWKDAYEAVEAAQFLFLRKHLPAMRGRARSAAGLVTMLARLGDLTPTHTRRSEESQELQQFSTPLELALAVAEAAAISPHDLVLEPSAGTGLLAVHALAARAAVHLNELSLVRGELLRRLAPEAAFSSVNAEHLNDILDAGVVPTVVLMNPPFSVSPGVQGPHAGADLRHLRSALARLAPGGRLVAITSAGLSPDNPTYSAAFRDLSARATLRLSCSLDGGFFRRHGTTITTRLTVFDKIPAAADHAPTLLPMMATAANLLEAIAQHVPPRLPAVVKTSGLPVRASAKPLGPMVPARPVAAAPQVAPAAPVTPLAYAIRDQASPTSNGSSEALYAPYSPERVEIPGAQPHPTKLVQSAAMASVRPPVPTYQPHLPPVVISQGLLSDAQLESVIYAGEAHANTLTGWWTVSETLDSLTAATAETPGAVTFRRGWFLGDGTGAGKGRQVAGIVLDNRLKGRRRALWVSKSDKLLEDAQRDWTALGQEKLLIVPQDRYRQGTPIKLAEGVLFTTYATLRSEREGKASRLQQLIDWLGRDFDGVIVFDEAHAMGNAAGSSGSRGDKGPSQQGLAGLRLQHALPNARVVYVSATGATTVENLAYAQRLGLWGSADFPFETRSDFVSAMEQGGIASSEVLARDLKSLGLYMARSLSYDGVEVEMLEHGLTEPQIAIYDAYAAAYQVIHQHLDEALKAANVTGETATYNRQAKSAARSAFESNKQRFFNHLITAMKVPSLIRALEADLAAGRAAVIQLVSTAEALLERRLAEIPPAEWADLAFDITPREYVLDYLKYSFPTQLYETYTDEEGNLLSRPVIHDGQPVQCREAVEARDAMIESLASLPPVQSALDQILHHFGTDQVAEVTGRSRRIIKQRKGTGFVLTAVNRPPSASLAETQAFMDDLKRILVFSDAGGTGRSYHADMGCLNQRPRVHYLLEAGWKADTAIQGLGRSNRTNQKQPPLFRPVASDVRGEKRFLSTIARRLDSLGAITRGQRQTGGQGLFRASDNLESRYARDALRHFYRLLYEGKGAACSLEHFEGMTGLTLTDGDGSLREELPPISTFLNRLLALPIALQNGLFAQFEGLIEARVQSALAAGTYDMGLEIIRAESLAITSRQTIATAVSGATTELLEVARKDLNRPLSLEAVLARRTPGAILLANAKSGRAALQVPAASITLDDGSVEARVRLIRPLEQPSYALAALAETQWEPCDSATFEALWRKELADIPTHTVSRFHIVTGLLLPVWKRLPFDNPRVYRFQTDDGISVIGRLVPVDCLEAFAEVGQSPLSNDQAWARLEAGGTLSLDGGMTLRRSLVMGRNRIELTGFAPDALPRLKTYGLYSEIIAWKLRLFLPTGDEGPAILARLLDRHPLVRFNGEGRA